MSRSNLNKIEIMKKLIFAFALLLALNPLLKGQSQKMVIGVYPCTFSEASPQDVNSITEMLVTAFVKTKRFDMVDRTKMEALISEQDRQRTEAFINSDVIEQGKNLGAQYLIMGHIISAKADEMKATDDKGNVTVTYKAKLAISLNVIDATTGKIVSSEVLEPKAGNAVLGAVGLGITDPRKAITKAIKDIESEVDKYVGTYFPLTFPIVEIQEKDSKGNATKVLIAGGSEYGLKKGDKLKVVEIIITEVAGKTMQRKKEIGELKIVNVEDENFSICSVTTGGIDINSKFEAKANLQIITKD